MNTVYDWLTIAILAGLVVLFIHRSTAVAEPRDHLWQYIIAASGCAVANYLGNMGEDGAAAAVVASTLVFIHVVLKPFDRPVD